MRSRRMVLDLKIQMMRNEIPKTETLLLRNLDWIDGILRSYKHLPETEPLLSQQLSHIFYNSFGLLPDHMWQFKVIAILTNEPIKNVIANCRQSWERHIATQEIKAKMKAKMKTDKDKEETKV